jgi:hypothetical protein
MSSGYRVYKGMFTCSRVVMCNKRNKQRKGNSRQRIRVNIQKNFAFLYATQVVAVW